MEDSPIKTLDIQGKKKFNCPYCNSECQVEPREISMEKLRHIQAVDRFEKWHKEHVSKNDPEIHGVANARLAICLNCGKPIILKDGFSREH